MELHYLRFSNYKGLQEIEVNLGNQYRYGFDSETNTLSVADAPNYIPAFFGNNISNFSAVVGENGTGKTTLLKYIVEFLSGGRHNHQDKNSIVVFRKGRQMFYFSDRDIMISSNRKFNRIKNTDEIRDAAVTIFLANTFETPSYQLVDYLGEELGGNKNLASSFLMYAEYQNKTGKDAFNQPLSFEERITAFNKQELLRMVRLMRWLNLKESHGRPFPVNPPRYLNFTLTYQERQESDKLIQQLGEQTGEYFRVAIGPKNKFLINAFLASIDHFAAEINFVSGPDSILSEYLGFIPAILEYLSTHKYQNHPKNSVIGEINDIFYWIIGQRGIHYLQERVEKIQSFLNALDEFINTRNVKILIPNDRFSVEITKLNKHLLEEFIEGYFKADNISGFADFYFTHDEYSTSSTLSSGEYAMLTLFGRLYSLKLEVRKPLLLLVDEAELALHPQWQKDFIFHFVDFLVEKFSTHRIQIILTAHSPFILSDMPPNCVVLLQKENGKTVVVDSLKNRKETFGANIHELLTDSFFLSDGLMGEFARRKISALIEELNGLKEISIQMYEDRFKSRIAIIGEPFLKAKILEIVAEKSNSTLIDKIVDERMAEIELLRNIQKKK